MPKIAAADLAIDQVHCRAICDEIGERLRYLLNREVSDIPSNLFRLVSMLDEMDRLPVVLAPSIVSSLEQTIFAEAQSEAFGSI